ncbi:MAG TPA: NAD(P)-binding domain-containing protein [Gaiellaceae bacterium]|nr:NAD(P)-binding domain-containing protein [Gaiellaceae bacterium]
MLVLRRSDVEELLDLDELLEALARAHAELSAGAVSLPTRIAAYSGDAGLLGAMPAYLPSAGPWLEASSVEPTTPGRRSDASGVLGCKLVTLFPGNADRPTHQAAIMLFDETNGTPVALLDGTYVTEIRTAAAAALAARLLARDDARILAVLGTGAQARMHLRTFAGIRDWDEVRVAGRDPAKAEALAADTGATAAATFEAAVRGADVVAATTHADVPVVRRDWLAPGAHVSSVGYNQAGSELDPAIVADAVIVVETRAVLAPPPAGALELAGLDESAIHAELGELVAGTRPGRTSPEEITLYKSVGVAVQDLAAAALVLATARERGAGVDIELEEIHV